MTRKRTAEIAGGGFAGLVAGAALAQRGWSVRLHEAAPELRNFGAGIYLWENGIQVLEAVGAREQAFARFHQAAAFEDRLSDGTLLAERSLPYPGGGRLIALTRQDLHSAVTRAALDAGVEVRTNSLIVEAWPDGYLIAEDGSRWPADLVIGADGIRSRVRDTVALLAKHEVFPYGVYRFLVPFDLAGDRSGSWSNYATYWNVEDQRRVLYTPCNDSDLYLLLGAMRGDRTALGPPLSSRPWRDSFPFLESLLSDLPSSARFDYYEVLSCANWSEGRVAVVGDAAHAMPPTLGQGAGTAMMNALSLAAYVSDSTDIDAALAEWEKNERPLTDQTQQAAVEFVRKNVLSSELDVRNEWRTAELIVGNHVPAGTTR